MGTIRKISEAEPDAAPESESDTEENSDRKIRRCLMCGQPFLSEWAGERICRNCKGTAAWRTG